MKRVKLFIFPVLSILAVTSCVNKPAPIVPNIVEFTLSDVDTSSFDIHTDWQKELIESSDPSQRVKDDSSHYGYFSNSKPNPITISFTETNDKDVSPSCYYIEVSENGEFSNASKTMKIELHASTKSYDLYNFKINTNYQYRVLANYGKNHIFSSEPKSFIVNGTTPRNYFVDGVENVRDLGGYTISDGVYKQGLLYRCGRLNKSSGPTITESGKTQFIEELHVKTEVDLRKTSDSEFAEMENYDIHESPAGARVNYVTCPMEYASSNIFTNSKNLTGLRRFFDVLSDRNNYPIAFHCSIGTDRTGALSYALGALMGVSEEELMLDYLFSNLANISGRRYKEEINGEDFYVQGIKNATGETLSQKAENYLISTVGVSKTTLDTIRSILVESN